MPVHPVSGAFVRSDEESVRRSPSSPHYEVKQQVRGRFRRSPGAALASPGAGDYPPDFLAHEIGPCRAVRQRRLARARPNWLKEMDVHMAARMTRRRPDGRYQVKVTTVRWRQRRQPVLVRRWKLRPVLVRSWKLRP